MYVYQFNINIVNYRTQQYPIDVDVRALHFWVQPIMNFDPGSVLHRYDDSHSFRSVKDSARCSHSSMLYPLLNTILALVLPIVSTTHIALAQFIL